MKKLFLILVVCSTLLVACGPSAEEIALMEQQNQTHFKENKKLILGTFPYGNVDQLSVVVIDSCEYLVCNAASNSQIAITHKGNCKYCRARLQEDIKKILSEKY